MNRHEQQLYKDISDLTKAVQKLVVIDIHYLNVLEIMNKNEQQMYKDISNLTKAVQKLVKLLEKVIKDNA